MSPIWFAISGAGLAVLSGLLAMGQPGRRAWQLSVMLGLVIVVSTSAWSEYARDGLSGERMAVAVDSQNALVSSALVMRNAEAERVVHRFELSKSIPWARDVLLVLLVSVWLAFGFLFYVRRKDDKERSSLQGPVWLLLTMVSLLYAWVIFSALGTGVGEPGVRAALAGFEVDGLEEFSVPVGMWHYISALSSSAVLTVMLTVLGVLLNWMPTLGQTHARYGMGIGALLAVTACAMQLLSVGGLPWRPLEGALWANTLLLGSAWIEGRDRLGSALPCVLGLIICGMALG